MAALTAGDEVAVIPPSLLPVFHQNVQAYLRSRLLIDPKLIAQNVEVPFTVIGGSADLQVEASDSMRLVGASSERPFIQIEGMTHTLKQVVSAASDQSAEYTDPTLPLAPPLVEHIVEFIRSVTTLR